jgi:hypothetical protein
MGTARGEWGAAASSRSKLISAQRCTSSLQAGVGVLDAFRVVGTQQDGAGGAALEQARQVQRVGVQQITSACGAAACRRR